MRSPIAEAAEPAKAPGRRSRTRWASVLAVLLLAASVVFANRVAIGTWLALNAPRVLSHPLEQRIGFATTSDGVRIAYATTGQGPPLVFVLGWLTHLQEGLGSPLYDAVGLLRWYSRDHLVVRYDGRGFGLSDRNIADFSLDARVRDLEAVVRALGLEHFALYAYSGGGPTAVAYTDRHPEQVTRLVLAATFLGRAAADEAAGRNNPFSGLGALARTDWELPAARAAFVELLASEAGEVERHVLMHFLRIAGEGSAVAGFIESTAQIDVSEQARRIRIPTLVVAGNLDLVVPVESSRALAAAIPGARFEILEGANHIEASVLDPRLMRLVSAFLAEGEVPGSPR
ncbi:MAG TPA: alpha/beta fold hydrolase [Myxococcota bacterium]|nr:alpha/beta fold hydrolase [Myxococcota bacterium]